MIKLENFEPKFSFKAGLTKFVNWVNSQEIKVNTYDESITELKERGLFK